MQSAKHLAATTEKLSNVPELSYKKGQLMSPLSPKPKEKPGTKSVPDKTEPMVLRSPPTGDSVMRYALPIPSNRTKESLAGEMVRRTTKHLQAVVAVLENTYGAVAEDGEVIAEEKDLSLSLGDDMRSFLNCCSQFAVQLDEASREEYNILDSLFKWFQQQVNQMEEVSKDPSILEEDLPSPDKTIHLGITHVVKLIDKFKELRRHLKEKSRGSMILKPMDKDNLSEIVRSHDAIEKKIEEFIKAHSTEDSESVPAPDTDSPYSVSNRLNVMIKIFENRTNKLERALSDQRLLEAKYKQMQSDFELLSEEKLTLESEVQKLKVAENAKPTSKDDHPKKVRIEISKEELHREKSATGELTSAELLQDQEAERNKNQLDNILKQRKKPSKSEESAKTKMRMGFSKTEVAREDSISTPLERQPKTTFTSGGQKKDDKNT